MPIHIRPHNRKLTTALCGDAKPKEYVLLDNEGKLPANLPNKAPCSECMDAYSTRRRAVEEQAAQGEFRAAASAAEAEEEAEDERSSEPEPQGPHAAWGQGS
jgi:hypothetical protein